METPLRPIYIFYLIRVKLSYNKGSILYVKAKTSVALAFIDIKWNSQKLSSPSCTNSAKLSVECASFKYE